MHHYPFFRHSSSALPPLLLHFFLDHHHHHHRRRRRRQIVSMLDERCRLRSEREFDQADAIKERLLDEWGVAVQVVGVLNGESLLSSVKSVKCDCCQQ
jgi:hypothetical protein